MSKGALKTLATFMTFADILASDHGAVRQSSPSKPLDKKKSKLSKEGKKKKNRRKESKSSKKKNRRR